MEKHDLRDPAVQSEAAQPHVYVPPVLTPLGAWQALTLITTLPIGPGNWPGLGSDGKPWF